VALTEALLADPLSFQLPRKFKAAFSGCGEDCAATSVSDLGFVARRREGVEGFAVCVAGGMGARSRVATRLEEFVPAERIVAVAEAVKRVFDKHGNRRNRHRARLRFLLEDIGIEAFRELYQGELAALPATPTELRPALTPTVVQSPVTAPGAGFAAWRAANVQPQRQAGFLSVEVPMALGVVDTARLLALADVVEGHGEGMLRATNWQTAILRWVPEAALPSLHAGLLPLGLGQGQPPILRRLVACAGASTCRLGICLSRGLAAAIAEALAASSLPLDGPVGALGLNLSGCPNACGRHPVADIGLSGAARRIAGRLAPHYTVQLGGRVREGTTTLATGSDLVPARYVPAFVVDLLGRYRASPLAGDFAAFLEAGGRQACAELAANYATRAETEAREELWVDWGAGGPFSLAGRGPGECGAGVFDLIEVDLASAQEAFAGGRLFAATALAARALLITRGEQADGEAEALRLFDRHFVQAGVLPPEHHPVVQAALACLGAAAPAVAFRAPAEQVSGLIQAVQDLYAAMGPSLRAPAPAAPVPAAPTAPATATPDSTKDLRGVACPLNYAKTKVALAGLRPGQVLQVLLDGEGARNVPESAARDGHQVLAVHLETGHSRVLLRRGSGPV
jgi:sulfite reductase (ferredoxin)